MTALYALILLNACNPSGGPEPAAIALCEAIPGASADAVTEELARDLIDPEDWQIWREEPDTFGYETMGSEAWGVVRGNSRCEIASITDDAITLTRYEPDFAAVIDGELETWTEQERVPRSVTLRRVEIDGEPRLRFGVAELREALEAAWAQARGGDSEGASAAVGALYAERGDPSLVWEIWGLMREERRLIAAAALEIEAAPEGVLVSYDVGGGSVIQRGWARLICADGERRQELPSLSPGTSLLMDWPEDVDVQRCAAVEIGDIEIE